VNRHPTAELLDTDSGTPEEVAASLLDLESFNRQLGGVATTRELIRAVARVTGKTEFSLLDVAAGNGFVPTNAAQELGRAGITVRMTLLDRATTHLPKNGAALKIVADALTLPFPDAKFDVVSCSLFLHHLSPDQVVQFVREARRVCRFAVVIHDLVRHWFHLALAYAGVPLYRSRLTRHDAPASVRQAYTIGEMRQLLKHAGATNVRVQTHYLFRMGVIVWK
jgi:ubiquinone/menaquinone biosynthesis C-methylase UbiE